MSYHFDLLKEPWIPVVDQEGKSTELGILEALERAHELREIADGSPLVEYGLYRLLCVFLMDALRPDDIYDIQDLLEEGRFDMETIQEYVQLCLEDGASFDLFDEKRPFLQTPYREEWDKKVVPVGYLDCSIATGNNHTHFNHFEENRAISYKNAAQLLVTHPVFVTMGGKGYFYGINGAPPYYAILKGNNLFQTLCNLLIPIETIEDFDSTPVFWRTDREVPSGDQIERISWLYASLFPSRRILLIPQEGSIQKIYYGPGMKLSIPENWTDPCVTYHRNTDKRFTWTPKEDKEPWRNLLWLIDSSQKENPAILRTFWKVHWDEAFVHICLYGVKTDRAKYYDVKRYDLRIPAVITESERCILLKQCLDETEKLGSKLKKSIDYRPYRPKEHKHGTGYELSILCEQQFFQECEPVFWDFLKSELMVQDVDGDAVLKKWCNEIAEIAERIINRAIEKISLSGKEWIQFYEKMEILNKYLITLKRKGH